MYTCRRLVQPRDDAGPEIHGEAKPPSVRGDQKIGFCRRWKPRAENSGYQLVPMGPGGPLTSNPIVRLCRRTSAILPPRRRVGHVSARAWPAKAQLSCLQATSRMTGRRHGDP